MPIIITANIANPFQWSVLTTIVYYIDKESLLPMPLQLLSISARGAMNKNEEGASDGKA
ncbi:MAG: hypothetical protein PHU14_02905 [Methylovulum sp.]|nr:hypothetical protein [Methylovulum sp.]